MKNVKIIGDRNTCSRLVSKLVSQIEDVKVLPDGSHHKYSIEKVAAFEKIIDLPLSDDEKTA